MSSNTVKIVYIPVYDFFSFHPNPEKKQYSLTITLCLFVAFETILFFFMDKTMIELLIKVPVLKNSYGGD